MVDVDALYEVMRRTLENGYGTTQFSKVYGYEPMGAVPGAGPFAAFWFTGEGQKEMTMGNVMVWHQFEVALFWPISIDLSGREATDRAILKACRDVQTAFRANSQLDGTVSDMDISEAQAGYGEFGNAAYRVLRWTMQLWSSEEEAIVA